LALAHKKKELANYYGIFLKVFMALKFITKGKRPVKSITANMIEGKYHCIGN
jgi:hypothetical protein